MPINLPEFPDIRKIIYEERNSIEGIRTRFIEEARKTSPTINTVFANKLETSYNMLKPTLLKKLQTEFFAFHNHMAKFAKQEGLPMSITRRVKSFMRHFNKLLDYANTKQPLARSRDFIGFRVVLIGPSQDTAETVVLPYKVITEILDYFVRERGAIPLEPYSSSPRKFDSATSPSIVIPKSNTKLLGDYFNNVRDYIIEPNEKGYQSLHVVIEVNGLTIEIQVRTFAMDLIAEYGSASHRSYEEKRQKISDICLDYSKIQIPGFAVVPIKDKGKVISNKVVDKIGLVKSIDPFELL